MIDDENCEVGNPAWDHTLTHEQYLKVLEADEAPITPEMLKCWEDFNKSLDHFYQNTPALEKGEEKEITK